MLHTLLRNAGARFYRIRAGMIDRNAELLRWIVIFGITQTAAVVGLVRLWR